MPTISSNIEKANASLDYTCTNNLFVQQKCSKKVSNDKFSFSFYRNRIIDC